MPPADRIAEWTTRRRLIAIGIMLLLTVVIGYGATAIGEETGLGQFETESLEGEKLEFINDNFGIVEEERATTAVQIIVRDENVLSRDSLIATIDLQQDLRDDPAINETLSTDPFADVASAIAITIYQENAAAELRDTGQQIEEDADAINETTGQLIGTLDAIRDLQQEYGELNQSYAQGEIDNETYASESQRISSSIDAAADNAADSLEPAERTAWFSVVEAVRSLQQSLVETEIAYQADEIDEYTRDERIGELTEEMAVAYDRVTEEVVAGRYAAIEQRSQALEEEFADLGDEVPSLTEQRTVLEEVDEARLHDTIERLFTAEESRGLLGLMPTDYEPGSPVSDARVVSVTQVIDDDFVADGDAPDHIIESQLRMSEIVQDRFGDNGFVFGQGIITDELNRSLEDSLALVIPFALFLVIGTLMIAYRDVLDIVLGVAGIGIVLVWTFGFMGWAGIEFNQIFIAVPVLLIGLSIDYAIHVFMRQREQRDADPSRSSGAAMRVALGGLLVALTWVTATAVFGFLSNLISPVAPIREFGLVSAFGIASALVVFGILVPAVKVTLDDRFERLGVDRHKRAFGTGGGGFTRVLSSGQRFAKRAPVVVLVVVLVLTAGGVYGASQIDTSFEVEDFIADEPPAWSQHLPEPFRPGEYAAKSNLAVLDDRFLRQDLQAQILIEGTVTDDDTLQRLHSASTRAGEQPAVVVLADGQPDIQSPLTVMQSVAAQNESFNETFTSADTSGDGVPDGDLSTVYDALFAAAPERAADVIYRTDDGEYRALLVVVSVRGEATAHEVTSQMRSVAADMEGDGLEATATGQLVVFSIIEDELFETVYESLLISLISVILFLMLVYRITDGSAILGLVTLFPIVLAVAWILGTMYLLGMPFNVVTGTITSLTIGLGVAYNIHMSERYRLELSRGHDVWEALHISVTGTGGALLGSAATTAAGFGVLAVAIIPILQQFGIITAITIIYAFLGSVLVLPSLLVLWTKYFGPGIAESEPFDWVEEPVADDP